MSQGTLQGRFVQSIGSGDGKQADIMLVEPNGDEHMVRCLVKSLGTEIGGDGEILAY